ncbi:MAG: heavy metal-binding domain-containing protein [bacterium]
MKQAIVVAACVAWLAGCGMPMMCGMGHGGHDHGDHAVSHTTKPAAVAPAVVAPAVSASPAAAEVWACPMGHFTSDKPGKCPTCGMELVKK